MITLPRTEYEKILAEARLRDPDEACGLIAGHISGKDKIVEKVYILENIDHCPEHFSLDPKEQLQAVKDMRANGLVPLGNWHSHPATPSHRLSPGIGGCQIPDRSRGAPDRISPHV